MDINKYIGLPFRHHGRDFDGVDCYGLVRLVLSEEFDVHLPDYWAYEDANDMNKIDSMFDEYLPIHTQRVEAPEVGNIVLFKFRGYTSHIVIYDGDGKVLHVMRGMNSVCVPVQSGILRGRLEGYYAAG